MTTTKTSPEITRLLAESARLFPGQSHDGCFHVLLVDGRLLWADTVGEGEIDPTAAGEIADEFARLDPEAESTYDRANEIVTERLIPGTTTW